MKNLLFGLIATVLFGNLIYSQENPSIGKVHNLVLSEYYINYQDDNISDLVDLNKKLWDLNKKHNSLYFAQISELEMKNFTTNIFGCTNSENFNYSNILNKHLSYLKENKIISESLYLLFKNINDNMPSKDVISSMLNNFTVKKDISSSDKKIIDNFIDIFNYSDLFWNSHGLQNVNLSARCNPASQVRFADAFGGLIGGVIGAGAGGFGAPFGAFLGSQLYSAFVEEMQDQHGGGCI